MRSRRATGPDHSRDPEGDIIAARRRSWSRDEVDKILRILRRHAVLPLTIAISLLVLVHFFERFPNGWDQAEYAVLATFKGREPGRLRFLSIALCSAVLLKFLAPSAFLIVRHWSDPERDAVAHYTPSTLGAIWMSRNLPPDALVIQSSQEWNVNLLPDYSGRQHVLRNGPLLVFVNRGKFTPMNRDSYEPLTTDFLRSVIASGRPVYAFEREPLKASRTGRLDPGAFEWEIAASPSLDSVQPLLPVPESVRRRLFQGVIVLYRARLR